MTKCTEGNKLADKLAGIWTDISPVCTAKSTFSGTVELRWRGHMMATLTDILGHDIFSVVKGIVEVPGMDTHMEPVDITVAGSTAYGEYCGKVSVMEAMIRKWPETRMESSMMFDLCIGDGVYGGVEINLNEIRFRKLKSASRWEYAGLRTMCRYADSITGQIEKIDQRKLEKELNSLRTL